MSRLRDRISNRIAELIYGRKHSFWLGEFEWELRDKDGTVIDKWTSYNALVNDGELNILESYFTATNTPIAFYMGLCAGSPAITSHLTDLTGEPIGDGYSRQVIARDGTAAGWPTIALDSGHGMATSLQVTFESTTGAWGPVTYAFLGSGSTLIAYVVLSSAKTLSPGQSLLCRMKVKLR